MSLDYSGPATLHILDRDTHVHADLHTDVSAGVYSWGGQLRCPNTALTRTRDVGGTLTLPDCDPVEVHVVVADLSLAHGGVRLRVDGHGRAPYEQDGEITTRSGEDGATVYEVAE